MAAKNNNGPTWTGNLGRTFPLPPSFKCLVGGEWQPAARFSKNQLGIWYKKKHNANDGITPANIGLTCREHNGEPALTLKCNGPCGLWKERSKFSLSQKRSKLAWCTACIQWRVQQDYDSVPLAAPNEVNESVDEEMGFTSMNEAIASDGEEDNQYQLEDLDSIADVHSISNDETDYDTDDHDFMVYLKPDQEAITSAQVTSPADLTHRMAGLTTDSSFSSQTQSVKPTSQSNQKPCWTSCTTSTSASREDALHLTHTNTRATNMLSKASMADNRTLETVSTSVFSSDLFQQPSLALPPQTAAPTWMPQHLRTNENLITLREKNLIGRHIPGYTKQLTATPSMIDDQIPPHLKPTQSQCITGSSPPQLIGRQDNPMTSYTGITAKVYGRGPDAFIDRPTNSHSLRQLSDSKASGDSRDSWADVGNMSTNTHRDTGVVNSRVPCDQVFNAFDPQGNVHRRVTDHTNATTSRSASRPPARYVAARKQPTRGNFARPDRRKVFNTVRVPNPRSGGDHIEVYVSGSEDEM